MHRVVRLYKREGQVELGTGIRTQQRWIARGVIHHPAVDGGSRLMGALNANWPSGVLFRTSSCTSAKAKATKFNFQPFSLMQF